MPRNTPQYMDGLDKRVHKEFVEWFLRRVCIFFSRNLLFMSILQFV